MIGKSVEPIHDLIVVAYIELGCSVISINVLVNLSSGCTEKSHVGVGDEI